MYAVAILNQTMLSIEQITAEALSLPDDQRLQLVEQLIESFESEVDGAVQTSWIAEAKRRRDEIRSGAVQPIPGEDALAQVRAMLG